MLLPCMETTWRRSTSYGLAYFDACKGPGACGLVGTPYVAKLWNLEPSADYIVRCGTSVSQLSRAKLAKHAMELTYGEVEFYPFVEVLKLVDPKPGVRVVSSHLDRQCRSCIIPQE